MAHAARSDPVVRAPVIRSPERLIPWLRWLLVLVFVGAGVGKLAGVSPAVTLFAMVGLGQWFRYAVGFYELAGAALLAYPRTTVAGAAALSALMLGAGATEILILDRPPLSSAATLVALVLLAALVRTADRSATRFP
jgi:putative oxidoreductase